MKIIGHRGASGYKPENTLASFKEAVSLGVDMVECDVYALKTGEVVVFHDDRLERTTNGKGALQDMAFDDLRKLDAGNGEKIPLLSEVLDTLNKKVAINIELKGRGTATLVAAIIDEYVTKKKWSKALFLVSSFNYTELMKFIELQPTIHIGALFRILPRRFWAVTTRTKAV